ncbi:MAG: hypothetical protein EYC68_00700 [Chloroflexota bacterium]|nr:MAG: hypothetical protein EYC68_00700 [Chloroflexota bacterium]
MRKHLTAALIFIALTLLLTNPLGLHLWNSVEDKQDALLNTWIVAWVGHALVTNPLELFNTNIFYPYTNTLAFSEILLPPSLLAFPFTLATNNSIFGYNLALLAMLWLDAFAMYLFVYDLTRRAEAGWVAGIIYAFNPFNLGNFAQLQLLTLGFLPLALLFLHKLLESNTPSRARVTTRSAFLAFLFAFFFILQSLSSFYYALLSGFTVAVYLLWWLVTQRAHLFQSLERIFVSLLASFALIAIVLTPFLLPYFQVQRELGFSRRVEESEPFSASLKQFSEVAPKNILYGKFLAPNPVVRVGGYPLDNLFPGVIAVLLAIFGLIFSRVQAKTFLVTLFLVSLILALGPRLYLTSEQATDITLPYRWLYEIFPPLRALRAPVRFDALVNFALAALAGLGAAALLEKFQIRRASVVALGIVAFIALEYLSLPAANITPLPVANEIPDVYKWLAGQPEGVALELPMMGPNENNELDISTQYFTTYHWQKTPDGYSGFIPPRRGEIAYEMQSFPSPRSIALLRALDVDYVIVPAGSDDGAIRYPAQLELAKKFESADVYHVEKRQLAPNLEKSLYVPSSVAAGAPFDAYLILVNRADFPYAVKPTDFVRAEARWSENRIESLEFPIPLVTSSVSVVPIRLTAPARVGEHALQIQTLDSLIGAMQVDATVNVGNELAREVVLPASVKLSQPLADTVARGDNFAVNLLWLPFNKVNAYYSASVRLVNQQGDKIVNVDREPVVQTFLWRPEEAVADTFDLEIPRDIPSGKYRVEVLMYQANSEESALLLDENFAPQQSIVLGEIEVK